MIAKARSSGDDELDRKAWEKVLKEVEIKKPRIPVVSNVDAKSHSDPEVIRDILTKQVSLQSVCLYLFPTEESPVTLQLGTW